MTLYSLPQRPRPPRSGEPWTDEDYAELVRRCRDGDSAQEIAEALGRRDTSVFERAKRMLPLDERGAPRDRCLARLRHHVTTQEDYDWEQHLVATPPPRPIVTYENPAPILGGIPGLSDPQLLELAVTLGIVGRSQPSRVLRADVARQLRERGLDRQLLDRVRESAERGVEDLLEEGWLDPYGRDDFILDSPEPDPWCGAGRECGPDSPC